MVFSKKNPSNRFISHSTRPSSACLQERSSSFPDYLRKDRDVVDEKCSLEEELHKEDLFHSVS